MLDTAKVAQLILDVAHLLAPDLYLASADIPVEDWRIPGTQYLIDGRGAGS
jgi:hypothetical protein